MLVTIICDASFCQDTHAAGYGFWIVSDRGRLGGGDVFLTNPPDIATAELWAIVNSVAFAFSRHIAEFGDHIRVQTDCMAVIHLLTEIRAPKHTQEAQAVDTLRLNLRRHAATFTVVHVKGHTRKEEARFVTNRIADKRAKMHMRHRRKDIAAQQCVDTLTNRGILP